MTGERILRLTKHDCDYYGVRWGSLEPAPKYTDEEVESIIKVRDYWFEVANHIDENATLKNRIKELEKELDVLNMWFGDAVDGETKFKEKADAWDRYCELMNELQDYVGCVRTPGDVMIAEQKRRQTVAELQARIKELEVQHFADVLMKYPENEREQEIADRWNIEKRNLKARIKELETELGKKFKPNAYDNDGNPIQYEVE